MTIAATEKFVLNFDLNNGCNLHCVMCGGRSKPSAQQVMPLHQFKERILPLFQNISAFQFGCQCEPLLLPYFNEAVRLIGKTAPATATGCLMTNGMLLSEEISQLLIDTPVFKRLRFSWDASQPTLFETIRCGASFEQLTEKIRRLVRLRDAARSSCSVEFNVTVLKQNIHDLPAIIRLAGTLGINRVTTNRLAPDHLFYVADDFAKQAAEYMAQATSVAEEYGIQFEPMEYRTSGEHKLCADLIDESIVAGCCTLLHEQRHEFVMDADGTLHTPCRKIVPPIANALSDDLAGMIREGLPELLEPIFSKTSEECLGCHLLQLNYRTEDLQELAVRQSRSAPLLDFSQIQQRVESIEGHMAPGQERFLFNKVRSLKDDAVILEIGAFKGRSTVAMGYACLGTARRLICIDTWNGNDSDFPERDFFAEWQSNIAANGLSEIVTPLRMSSADFLPALRTLLGQGKIGMAFIDGSHQYQEVIQDYYQCRQVVEEGGIIALHDVTREWPGTYNAWHTLVAHELDQIEYFYSIACGKVRPRSATLPIHFFTIVLNGEPFIRHHIDVFRQLPFEWHWHIVEGVAELVHDTAWSLQSGGRITDELHANGLSNDGTSRYLDELAERYPDQVTLYRKPAGQFWNGKLEMVNAPLANIRKACLLWQVDSDELWHSAAITALRDIFVKHPEKTAAYCYCDYFVGPRKYVSSLNTWATYSISWLRVWRYANGMCWSAHEPPTLVNRDGADIASLAPISRDETVQAGVTFQHFAYVLESQVRFKEIYYGYRDAVTCWQRLQQTSGPVKAADYLPWALPDAVVDDWPSDAAPHLAERFFAVAPAAERYISMSVHGATRFEHELRELFKAIRPQTVIETGTFLGQGTTSIIWRAVSDLGLTTDITTIEVNPEHHRLASEYFAANRMNIRAELGLSIPRSKLPDLTAIKETFVDKADTRDGSVYYDHDETERAALYYGETAFDVPDNLLEAALARCNFRPDFVLLDSAGHIGLAEFKHLLSLLRGPCHLMLDDINHCKHAATMQEIRRDPRFEIILESDEKFGFAIIRYHYIKRLLYLRTDAIGDNVLAASMLPEIRKHYPGALLTVICQDRAAALYDACPYVDGVISFNLLKLLTNTAYRKLVLERINQTAPELLLNSIYSHDLHDEFLAHHIQAPRKIALEGDTSNRDKHKFDATRELYTTVVPNNPADQTELDHHRTFLRGIGLDVEALSPQVWISTADQAWADNMLSEQGIAPGTAIMLFPGALLDCKTYPHYAEVLAGLTEHALIICGGEELHRKGDELCRAHGGKALNLAGLTTLGQMAALMRRAKLYLGSDSSGMHIACAVGLKNVVLLGGGHFGRFCPYSPFTTAVCLPLSCYSCNWHCRYARVHCLHDIRPDTVLQAIEHSLAATTDAELPTVFVQHGSAAPDSPPYQPGMLKGCFKLTDNVGDASKQ